MIAHVTYLNPTARLGTETATTRGVLSHAYTEDYLILRTKNAEVIYPRESFIRAELVTE